MGVGVGAGFPLGLTAIAWRAPDAHTAAATSGLALGVGYTAAGLGPLLMGVLIDVTGGYALGHRAAGRGGPGAGVGDLRDRRPRTRPRRCGRRRAPRPPATRGASPRRGGSPARRAAPRRTRCRGVASRPARSPRMRCSATHASWWSPSTSCSAAVADSSRFTGLARRGAAQRRRDELARVPHPLAPDAQRVQHLVGRVVARLLDRAAELARLGPHEVDERGSGRVAGGRRRQRCADRVGEPFQQARSSGER